MAEANDTAGLIYQNLIDAGCYKQTTGEMHGYCEKKAAAPKCFPYSHSIERPCLARCDLGKSKLTAWII